VASLYTDNGWPVFWCDLSSATAVAAAENRTAVLTVSGPAAGPQTVTVLLAGRLELIGSGWERGRRIGAVALALEQVLVETYAPGRPAVTRPVPVSGYADADPDALAARAQQLVDTPMSRTTASCAASWPPAPTFRSARLLRPG